MATQDPYDGKYNGERKRAASTGFVDRNPKRQNTGRSTPHSQRAQMQQQYRMQPGAGVGRNQSRQNRSNHSRTDDQHKTLIHYREQVLKNKQDELKKVRSHLQTFTKEKQWLLEKKPYFKFDHFQDFPGHRSLGKANQKNPALATDFFKLDQYNPQPQESSVGEYRDLNDPQICSRYRLGIAPVFGENLIFETPLASLAMSTSVVPDSLPEIEELESRQQEIDDQLQELQESIGRRIEPAQEPPRQKSKWDFLLQEMKLMAEDFARESKWKISNAKKISKFILKYFDKEETKRKNRAKIERARLKKISATMSKEVALFWSKVGKIYRIRTDIDARIEELKVSNAKLETFVAETEDYAANLKSTLIPENDEMDVDTPIQDRKEISETAKRMEQIAKNKIELCEDYRKKTPIPNLLRFGTLRDYQHVGLHWLASLHRNKTNGILADEMGLGKTIQTISLLAHLAVAEENWGPHLIIVPSSVIVNWEMEFKRWLPAFKILSYHGSKKEREAKRAGWSRENAFHACITSYNLVVREAKVFRRRRWQYMILDEAHQIKNFESKRWQTLLNFNTQDRLLLTGTPLQNKLQELWSLLHFLMPNVFESQSEFTEWFENPVNGMISRNQDLANSHIINRLHSVLKPFLLRRQKKDVEKQLPPKHFHVIGCRLSRRQRRLYEDFMAADRTKSIMQKSDYMGMMNIVMQLRKVCNHPDLFEGRSIRAPFTTESLRYHVPDLVVNDVIPDPSQLSTNVPFVASQEKSAWECDKARALQTKRDTILRMKERPDERCNFPGFLAKVQADLRKERKRFRESMAEINASRCKEFGHGIADVYHAVKIRRLNSEPHIIAREKRLLVRDEPDRYARPGDLYRPSPPSSKPFFPYRDIYPTDSALDMVKLPERRLAEMHPVICKFIEYHPPVLAPPVEIHSYAPPLARWERQHRKTRHLHRTFFEPTRILHRAAIRRRMNFPEKRLIQWDCGKLQALDKLLRKLKKGKHRCLIFTQMSKMLNVLEAFLNLYDYRYLRLDGSTKTEDRGKLMHHFNSDESIFCFILSTRSGGLGMNLTGADTVIFYDNDWNPAMDMQAQDRCHRIGQTREVHIYKLMSENTIEENILKKAQKKKEVMQAVMGDNAVGMDIFRDLDPWELLGMEAKEELTAEQVKHAMELAEDVEDREAANVAWQEAKMQAEDELVCDEHRERARWETVIGLLNPAEKYALSFFGKDRRPDPTISIKLLELQCRQLEKKLDTEMRYLRELNHRRPRQELTSNAGAVNLALKNIKLIPGVHFNDVQKVADINFTHYGIHRGPVSLLASDENVHDWGLFSNQKEIDLMLPRPKKRKVASSENEMSHIVKKISTKKAMRNSIRIDDQMNIHIPWCILPKSRQPVISKPRNGLRTNKTNLEQKSRPFQPTKSRKRPTKHQALPWNKREEKWVMRHNGFSAPFIEVKMHSHRQFSFKGRRSDMIQQKLLESRAGALRNRRVDALDMLNHDTLKIVAPCKEKFDETRKKHHALLYPDVQNPKGPTFESLVQKLKSRNVAQNPSNTPLTPKNVLQQQLQQQELQRSHQVMNKTMAQKNLMQQRRAAMSQNLAMQHAQRMNLNHYLQANPNFAARLQNQMGNPQYQRMMMFNQEQRYQRFYQQQMANLQAQQRKNQK